MKIIDIIFALVCGKVVGFVVGDILKGFGVTLSLYEYIAVWLAFPLLALFGLWVCRLIGRKYLFVFQAGKHALVGAFATVVDLKLFELLIWAAGFFFFLNPIIAKSISFIASTLIKYWGNKYWAFGKHEKEDIHKELISFFIITIIGLLLDVGAFWYLSKVVGVHFEVSTHTWTQLSVIFAAIVAALWNFVGYKFLVFKK
ncbi:MAG: GtrA family protein [Candidatus Paceibacterales bacterium]